MIDKLIKQSIDLCKENLTIFRIDFLCNYLNISCSQFYKLGLNENTEIREALNKNIIAIRHIKYSQLIQNEDKMENK